MIRTDYLGIHEKAYLKLRSENRPSWSDTEDVEERVSYYLRALAPESQSVLILGCGDGETSLALAAHGFHATGVDISPSAIQWAQEKARTRSLACDFRVENLASPGRALATYDAIIDDHCLHCIVGNDRSIVLHRIHAMLGHGGRFIVRTQCGDPPPTASPEFMKTWDQDSRCQIHSGVAGRYYGKPEAILQELSSAGLQVHQSRVFAYRSGWHMLEAIATR